MTVQCLPCNPEKKNKAAHPGQLPIGLAGEKKSGYITCVKTVILMAE